MISSEQASVRSLFIINFFIINYFVFLAVSIIVSIPFV